ncbi:hypothetical protein [Rahnella laticis]|uniref:hypothetical protein n=1 Tax=Rahnella laticis TaxID=2787622 RepID=UPI0018A2E7EB|nr:hypothetical protein [Rahnella laticis]MBF7997481.1 hypothetical protein [Rahnella laticis]
MMNLFRVKIRRRNSDRSHETALYIVSLYLLFFGLLGLVVDGIRSGLWNHLFAAATLPALPENWFVCSFAAAWLGGGGLSVNAGYCSVRNAWRRFQQRKTANRGKVQ